MAIKKRGQMSSIKSSFGGTWLTSTTVSETFGDGRIENVANIRSGYSCTAEVIDRTTKEIVRERTSRSFDRSKHPNPAPVPPPSEWMIWNP
jgi:hypothetical protein